MNVIRDGQQHFNAALETYAQFGMTPDAARMGVILSPLSRVSSVAPLLACVNHSRLIVECPDCGGAEFVWRDGPHLMMCESCWNGAVGGSWRRVNLPAELAEIETILAERALPHNRNWQSGESLKDLATDNIAHHGGA